MPDADRSLTKKAPDRLQRSGPDTDGGDQSMQPQANAIHVQDAPVDGLLRTQHLLVLCVVCGYEQIDTARQDTGCLQCGASAHRSFALFRSLREDQR
jgi:hypothetical protein